MDINNKIDEILRRSSYSELGSYETSFRVLSEKGYFKGLNDSSPLFHKIREVLRIDHIWFSKGERIGLFLHCFKNLRELKISKYQKESLPKSIVELTNLEKLSIANSNSIRELPNDLPLKLKNLKDISFISNGNLSRIPDNFSVLNKLERIVLSGNAIQRIPDWIYEQEFLTDLDLSEIPIDSSFIRIAELTSLSTLTIDGSDFSNLKTKVEFPDTLSYLYLRNNNLVGNGDFDAVFGADLTRVFMEENILKEVPSCLRSAKNIRELELSSNKLESLPEWLLELEYLEMIGASENFIREDDRVVQSLREKGVDVSLNLKSF